MSLAIGINSCTKSNTINNGQVISTPYTLYFTDTAGALYNSNDGKNMKVVFPPDGSTSLSIITANNSIIIAKMGSSVSSNNNAFVSNDNGKNFNYSYITSDIATFPGVAVNGRPFNLNQSMMIYVPDWNHEYITSRNPSGSNFFGMAGSFKDGLLNNWNPESYYDTDHVAHSAGTIRITSFTLLKNGTLIAFDAATTYGLYRTALLSRWVEYFTATSLPTAPSYFSIGHLNNQIIAIDNYGTNGAWYSNDLGVNWAAYSGLPANTPLMCIASPFEQVCLVGTDGDGVYILNPNTSTFQTSNTGLPNHTIVRNIAFKENIFKNGARQQYVYLATNNGIYQSTDMGNSWVRTVVGNFVCVY